MTFIPYYMQIALKVFPLTIHLFALYFLIKYRRCYANKSQFIHLLNLSLCELTFVTFGLISLLLTVSRYSESSYRVEAIQYSTIIIVYFLAMIYMTVDRFLEVRLNIFYPLYWKACYTKILLCATWSVCVLLSVTIALMELPDRAKFLEIIFLYVYTPFEFLFLVLSVAIYTYIFIKLKKNQVHVLRKKSGLLKHRKKKHFYVPVLIVLTFFMFIMIPDLLMAYLLYRYRAMPNEATRTYVYSSYMIGMSCDAIVYTFFSPFIRKGVKRIMKQNCCFVDAVKTNRRENASQSCCCDNESNRT